MSARRKTWTYFDENDQYLFMAESIAKWEPKIGSKVRVDGVDYSIWYIEDGRGVHNIRLELANELRPETPVDQ